MMFPWVHNLAGRATDHSPPSSAEVLEEYSYTSTHPLGHTGPVTGYFNFYISWQRKGSHVIGVNLYLKRLCIEGRGLDSSASG
jgi:hypothetical protein